MFSAGARPARPRPHAGHRRPARLRSGRRRGRRARRRDRADRRHHADRGGGGHRSRAGGDRRGSARAGAGAADALADRQPVRRRRARRPGAARGPGRAARPRPGAPRRADREPRARPRARRWRPRRPGELAVAFGGDGLVGAVAGALGSAGGMLGVLPGGRGNDFARVLGIPLEPVAGLRGAAPRASCASSTSARPASSTFVGIASCGFDSEANRIANQTRLVRGNLVYAYGALRALVGWQPATFEVTTRRRRAARAHRLHAWPPRTPRPTAAACCWPRTPRSRTACSTSCWSGQVPKLRFLRLLPTRVQGRARPPAAGDGAPRPEVQISADRPFTLYADGDPIAELPVTVRALPGARPRAGARG